MNTADYVGSGLGTCTLYRPIPLTSDAIYTPVNQLNMQAAEQRRQQYQHTLNQYPLPEPDKGGSINASLFGVSVVELPAGLTGYDGGMLCLPLLVTQVLASSGILQAETVHIDANRESNTKTPVIANMAPQGLQCPNDGCLYFDILMQECLHPGLSELHARMMEYERLLGRTNQLECNARAVSKITALFIVSSTICSFMPNWQVRQALSSWKVRQHA